MTEPTEIIPGFFNLVLVYNHGAAFGMFADLTSEVRRLALATVSLLALVVVFRFMLKEAKDDGPSQLALGAILGGAAGNIVDRLREDAVTDFLDCYVKIGGIEYHWPAFNIADSAICLGVGVLLVRMLLMKEVKDDLNSADDSNLENSPQKSVEPS
jgi:signal peptidase II